MKVSKILSLFLLFVIAAPVTAQVSSVLKEQTNVRRRSDSKVLMAGDTLHFADLQSFLFSSPTDFVTTVIPGSGIIIYRNVQQINRKNNIQLSEFKSTLIKLFIPEKHHKVLAGREGVANSFYDIENVFTPYQNDSLPLIVLNQFLIPINNFFYEERKTKYFYVSYTYRGKEVNKKLDYVHSDSTTNIYLRLDTNILKINKQDVSKKEINNYTLNYYNEKTDSSTMICILPIDIIKSNAIQDEICTIKMAIDKDWVVQAYSYFCYRYGSISYMDFVSEIQKLNCEH